MAEKRYFYKNVVECNIAYPGPVHRPDQKTDRFANETMDHSIRLKPELVINGQVAHYADVLVTTRPIARHFTEEVWKSVRRHLDPHTIKGRKMLRPKLTKKKFILVKEIEVDPRSELFHLTLRDFDYAAGDPAVYLSEEQAEKMIDAWDAAAPVPVS